MSSVKQEIASSIDFILFENSEESQSDNFLIRVERKPKKILSRQQILLRINSALRYLKVKNIQAPFDSTIFDCMNDFFDSLRASDLEKAITASHKLFHKSSPSEGLDFLYGYVMSSLYFEHYFTNTMPASSFNQALRENIISYGERINLDSRVIKAFLSYLFFDTDDYELYMKLDTLLVGRIRNNFILCLGLLKTLRHLLIPTENIF